MKTKLLSIIIPIYNEEDCISQLYKSLIDATKKISCEIEILFINDGSKDNTLTIIQGLTEINHRIRYIDLSRNFGKEIAISAGIDHINGDVLVIMDADLQHPPELLPVMLQEIEAGYDDVFARRTNRSKESIFKKIGVKYYYRILKLLSTIPIEENASDFRMLSKKAIFALRDIKENERNMKCLYSYIGFKKKGIDYTPKDRIAGKTKWSYFKLTELAIRGITSFSTIPLRVVSLLGLIISFCAFSYLLSTLIKYIIWSDPVAGYPSLICLILFIGGIILLSLGIISEYLGIIYNETKKRPNYYIKEISK